MTLALITKPASLPVDLAQLKSHLRIEHDDEDVYLSDLLLAATEHTELVCQHKLITQVWRQYQNDVRSCTSIALRIKPVQSIAAVTAYDVEGNPTLLASENYQLFQYTTPARVQVELPLDTDCLEIDLVCGYADMAVDVPSSLKRAVMVLASHWFEFRGAISADQHPASIPEGFENLIAPYKSARL